MYKNLCKNRQKQARAHSSGKWVHVICALFTTGVQLKNNNTMEPVDISEAMETCSKKARENVISVQMTSVFAAHVRN